MQMIQVVGGNDFVKNKKELLQKQSGSFSFMPKIRKFPGFCENTSHCFMKANRIVLTGTVDAYDYARIIALLEPAQTVTMRVTWIFTEAQLIAQSY